MARPDNRGTAPTQADPGANQAGQSEIIANERFRRRAAEAAQRQLERLAGQLREQLGEEVTRRKAAEARIIELTARVTLTDQIDLERQRLRKEKLNGLEQRSVMLELEVATLTSRLEEEKARRRQLEEASRVLANTRNNSGEELNRLKAQVDALKEKLAAEAWARKLAEAQLNLVTGGTAK